MPRSRAAVLALFLAALLFVGACSSEDPGTTGATGSGSSPPSTGTVPAATGTTSAEATPVVRDLLGQMPDPPGADGMVLTLARYTIPAGAQLAPHIHPGVQMAWIESSTLTYHVESASVRVRRAGASQDEIVSAPATIHLGPGDAVVELGDMVHFGANETAEPVVILAALLTEDGHELAEPPPGTPGES